MKHSLPKAFSLTWNRPMSVDDLLLQATQGGSVDPRSFRCLGENCQAKVILAGWFTPEEERGKRLHFRSFHHVTDCEYLVYLRKHPQADGCDPSGSESPALSFEPDRFDPRDDNLLSPPRQMVQQVADANNTTFGGLLPPDRAKVFSRLVHVVKRYWGFVQSGQMEGRQILVSGQIMDYEDYFQKVAGQDAQDHVGLPRVWLGPATLRKVKNGFQVHFADLLQWGAERIRPAFFVPEDWLEKEPRYSARTRELFDQARKAPVSCFCYATGDVHRQAKGDQVYLNIKAYHRSEFWVEEGHPSGMRKAPLS